VRELDGLLIVMPDKTGIQVREFPGFRVARRPSSGLAEMADEH
jgi:hypothetical protein